MAELLLGSLLVLLILMIIVVGNRMISDGDPCL
jgi:hypothetical protein